MQTKIVPVVIWENGKRYEVGEASVIVNGKNIAVMGEVLPAYSEFMLPENFELSLSAVEVKLDALDFDRNEHRFLAEVPPALDRAQYLRDSRLLSEVRHDPNPPTKLEDTQVMSVIKPEDMIDFDRNEFRGGNSDD